jgi:hypothetical protein
MPDTADTVFAPDDDWSYHSKHVEQLTNINKLNIIASFWTIIDIRSAIVTLCVAILRSAYI